MKSILMSIQPYYAYLEMKGIKTKEVRKTQPKSKDWSGKVKVYVSQNKKSFSRIPKEDREWFSQYLGKVAYEFICDKLNRYSYEVDCYNEYEEDCYDESKKMYYIQCGELECTCLTYDEFLSYGKGKTLYGLNITALKIYDKPKELGEITTYTIRRRYTTKKAKEFTGDGINIEKLMHGNRVEARIITKPPQSWQYVGEVENEQI